MRTLVSADYALVYEGGEHRLQRDAAIVIDEGRIAYAGAADAAPTDVDERIDLGMTVLTPGLIDLDALTDIDHLILDSFTSGTTLKNLAWSAEYFAKRSHVFTAAERQRVREIGLIQLALHGITTYMPIASEVHSEWAEDADDFLAMAEFSRKIGLRAFIGPSYRSGVNVVDNETGERDLRFDEAEGEAGLEGAKRFWDEVKSWNDELVTPVFLPCRVETLTPALLKATAEAATERNSLVRLHALQGEFEREYIIEKYGRSPLELIEDSGLLNDRLLIPHGRLIDISPDVYGEDRGDLGRLAAAGVAIVHCPLTNARYGSELETFERYRAAGVIMALGTDSFPPDLIRGIDTGVSVAKVQWNDGSKGDIAAYFNAATLGGAAALNRSDLGRLEVGAWADITAFALDDVRTGPIDDPLRNLVLAGTARDAVMTMVAGRVVMRDGQIEGIDLEAVRRDSQALFDKMKAAYSVRDFESHATDELFPPVFALTES